MNGCKFLKSGGEKSRKTLWGVKHDKYYQISNHRLMFKNHIGGILMSRHLPSPLLV